MSIIGAGGFVGQRLTRIAAGDPAITSLVLNDLQPGNSSPGAHYVRGSFADADIRAQICDADAIILLASILGGAAESDYALARKINVDAVLDTFEHLRDRHPGTRIVFASTIAVFGQMPSLVVDTTEPTPILTYGAQKLMMEVALSNFTTKGWLDGVSLRPSGIMARDGADAALKTAFMSRLFWCFKRGEDITLPVTPDAQTWMSSVQTVALNFLHAAKLGDLGKRRAMTMPALCLTFGDLVAALRRAFPDSPTKITYNPDSEIIRLFGTFPKLETSAADALGFQNDNTADELVARALM